MHYLELRNKPKAVVYPEHLPTGPLEQEEEEAEEEEDQYGTTHITSYLRQLCEMHMYGHYLGG
jgi:hypothetical protein